MKTSNMEAEAIRMMKAKKSSYATVGTHRFKLQCRPRREKEYVLLSFDRTKPDGHVSRTYISWEDYEKI